jgi:hypothetical protein
MKFREMNERTPSCDSAVASKIMIQMKIFFFFPEMKRTVGDEPKKISLQIHSDPHNCPRCAVLNLCRSRCASSLAEPPIRPPVIRKTYVGRSQLCLVSPIFCECCTVVDSVTSNNAASSDYTRSYYVAQQPSSNPMLMTHFYQPDHSQRKRPKYTRSKTGCLTCRGKKVKVSTASLSRAKRHPLTWFKVRRGKTRLRAL